MKRQTTITIMRIIEVITEAANPTGVNKAAGNLIEDSNRGEGDNKIITGANTKATVGNLTPPTEAIAIIIIITVIIEAEVDVAVDLIITEVTAVIEAITITNTTNITHMMMAHSWNNMAHHVHFAVALITLLSTVLKESMT